MNETTQPAVAGPVEPTVGPAATKRATLRWKKHPRETGPAAVGAGLRWRSGPNASLSGGRRPSD